MFQWLFGNGIADERREQRTKQLYDLLCSKEMESFKRICGVYRSQGFASVSWDFTDASKRTLLHVAAMIGDANTLDLLKHVPINAQDDQGYTALHYAVMINKSCDFVEQLIVRTNLDVNIQSNQGYTAYDIVEGYWQAECQRLFKQKKINQDFKKVFLEEASILFDKDISDRKLRDFLSENPAIKKFLQQHATLGEIVMKKQLMEQKKCQRKNEINFKTFLEPYFLYFDELIPEEKYWYDVPRTLSHFKVSNLSNKENLVPPEIVAEKEDTAKKAPVFELSKLYEKLEIIAVNNAMAEQISSTDTHSSVALQQIPKEKTDVIAKNPASDSFSANKTKVPVRHCFFTDEVADLCDNLSEYACAPKSC